MSSLYLNRRTASLKHFKVPKNLLHELENADSSSTDAISGGLDFATGQREEKYNSSPIATQHDNGFDSDGIHGNFDEFYHRRIHDQHVFQQYEQAYAGRS